MVPEEPVCLLTHETHENQVNKLVNFLTESYKPANHGPKIIVFLRLKTKVGPPNSMDKKQAEMIS